MESTKMLSEEHQNILKVADAIERECDALDDGKHVVDDFFKESIDFIRNYADKFHHAKEEDILFKEFGKCAEEGEVHCNPVEQMLEEHKIGRNFVKGIEEGMAEKNREKVIGNARGYVQLIREHISKEDDILYPMADEALSAEMQKSMLKEFKEAEKKKFAKGVKEKYLALSKKLEREGGKND